MDIPTRELAVSDSAFLAEHTSGIYAQRHENFLSALAIAGTSYSSLVTQVQDERDNCALVTSFVSTLPKMVDARRYGREKSYLVAAGEAGAANIVAAQASSLFVERVYDHESPMARLSAGFSDPLPFYVVGVNRTTRELLLTAAPREQGRAAPREQGNRPKEIAGKVIIASPSHGPGRVAHPAKQDFRRIFDHLDVDAQRADALATGRIDCLFDPETFTFRAYAKSLGSKILRRYALSRPSDRISNDAMIHFDIKHRLDMLSHIFQNVPQLLQILAPQNSGETDASEVDATEYSDTTTPVNLEK